MPPGQSDRDDWELPSLREAFQLPYPANCEPNEPASFPEDRQELWGVKFYPYAKPGVPATFAVVGGRHVSTSSSRKIAQAFMTHCSQIIIYRAPTESKKCISALNVIFDEELDNDIYACVWSKDLATGTPLICVAGINAKIKVINALTGALVRELIGHGGEIDDLVVSPTNPQILASCSEDFTIRLWSLDPAHAEYPCIAILGGGGHRDTVSSISFHKSGRYLLSGGSDHRVNLWALPEFPDKNTGTRIPTRIYYPHFSSSDIHDAAVDCIAFHGDLILSRSANEDTIVLWSITGFSSLLPVPSPSTAPTTHDQHRTTYSSFASVPTQTWTRYLQFNVPDSETHFIKFSLFPGTPSSGPCLCIGNNYSRVFFWDLKRFEVYFDYISSQPTSLTDPERPDFLTLFRGRGRAKVGSSHVLTRLREPSPAGTESSSSSLHSLPAEKPLTEANAARTRERWEQLYGMGDSLTKVMPHKEETIKTLSVLSRQAAWSADGKWCVVVGSNRIGALFARFGA